ncbi:siderophore ABC transporter substrate-binding protein [Vibrio paucivorans]
MTGRALLLTVGTVASFTVMADMVEIQHRLGSTTLEAEPKRVVVLGLGALDALDSLGVEPVAVPAVSQYPDYLNKYNGKQYVSAGSLFEPDFEAIYTQKPDVIIVGPRAAGNYDELSKIAPTIVFAADAKQGYWESTQEQWRNLGKVFNAEQQVEEKISTLDQEFKAIRDYNQSNSVDALTVMSSGGNITTFGAQSRFSAIYRDFGFNETVKNIKESRHGDLISYEFIRESNPSTLLIIDKDKLTGRGESNTHLDFENDLVKATPAYKNKHVAFLDLNAWYLSISGVRATEQMISDVKSSVGLN